MRFLIGGRGDVRILPRMGWTLALLLGAAPQPGLCQRSYLAASRIPAHLTQDAHVVKRLETVSFDAENPGRAVTRVHRVVTILDKDGSEASTLVIPYDKFNRPKSLNGYLIDAEGRVLRNLDKSDVTDAAATSDFSLYDDTRVRIASLTHFAYPYTVEFEYELEHHGIISWPMYYPQHPGESVEHATFEVIAPESMPVRYRVNGLPAAGPEIRHGAGKHEFRWYASNLPIRQFEPYGPSWEVQLPHVEVASSDFEIEGFRGDMSSWRTIGAWYYRLSAGRDVLPSEAAARVREIVQSAHDEREKARRIYEHLQRTTRYVSVQLGIGGLATLRCRVRLPARLRGLQSPDELFAAHVEGSGYSLVPGSRSVGNKGSEG